MSLENVTLTLIDTLDDIIALNSWLGERRPIHALGLDTETTGLHRTKDKIRLCQIGDGNHGWAFAWDRWSGILEAVVREWEGDWLLHNAPFDLGFLDRAGIHIPRHRVHDTMTMARINEPHMSMGLKNQATRHVDPAAAGLQLNLADSGFDWGTVPIEFPEYWQYGALDPVITYELAQHHWPIVRATAPDAYDLEMAVLWVVEKMMNYGTHVDRAGAQRYYEQFTAYCAQVDLWCGVNYDVKPGSNAAIIKILENAGFEFSKGTKSGAKALDAEVLGGIDHPLAVNVLQRRQLQKMASTYLRFYLEEADDHDLLHPSINTLGARTSRMSMDHPNLQNLPRRGTSQAGDVVRGLITSRYVTASNQDSTEFDPRAEGTLLMCDFAQIEMRLLAHFAQEPAMIQAFTDEGDFFVNLARQIFQDDSIDRKDPRRQITKNSGYAKIYGAGVRKFAQTAGIPEAQARAFLQRFDELYPGVRRFQTETLNVAMENRKHHDISFVTSPLTGRPFVADGGKEYALVNYLIQGSAAETFKRKLVELDAAGLGGWLFAPVHDEVLLDVPAEHVDDAVEVLGRVMNDDDLFSVPVRAEISYGPTWGAKRDWIDE